MKEGGARQRDYFAARQLRALQKCCRLYNIKY